jgi:hypothetical protein
MSELVVAVYREGKGFRVEPGRLLVRHADTIMLYSVDNLPVTVFVPPSLGGEARVISLGGHNPRFGLLPVAPGIAPGCYEYAVHVDLETEHVFAEGGSQPKIIVLE